MLILRGWFLTQLVARWQRWQVGRFSSRHRGSRGSGRVCWLRACPIDRRPRVKSKFLICGSTSTTCTIINLSQSTFTFSRTFYKFLGRRRWSIFTMLYVVCRVDRRYVLVGIKTEDTINFTVTRSQRSGCWDGTKATRWLQLLTPLLLLSV